MNGVESIDELLFDAFARREQHQTVLDQLQDALVAEMVAVDGCTQEIERLLDRRLDEASAS